MKIHQPRVIRFHDKVFTLKSKFVELGGGITEGPFYEDTEGNTYLPDLAYTLGQTETPVAMHRVGNS